MIPAAGKRKIAPRSISWTRIESAESDFISWGVLWSEFVASLPQQVVANAGAGLPPALSGPVARAPQLRLPESALRAASSPNSKAPARTS